MGIFFTKCQNCGARVSRRARYCSKCGAVPSGSRVTTICWKCGKEVSVQSEHCPYCGTDLTESALPVIEGNRWLRKADEFAARIDLDDLEGFLKKDLFVEGGTKAAFIVDGRVTGEVGPGFYRAEGLLGRLPELKGAKKAQVILAVAWDVEFQFEAANVYTKDPIPINVSLSLSFCADDLQLLATGLLRDRPSVSEDEIRGRLVSSVREAVGQFVGGLTVEDIERDSGIRDRLEAALASRVQQACGEMGLGFRGVKAYDFFHEVLDRRRKQREKLYLAVSEQEAETEGKRRLFDARTKDEIEKIRERTISLKIARRKQELLRHLRDLAAKGEMDRLRAELEQEKFRRELEKEHLLSKDDLDAIAAEGLVKKGTREAESKHALEMLEIRLAGEREKEKMLRSSEMELAQIEHEVEKKTLSLRSELEMKRMNLDAAVLEMERWGEAKRAELLKDAQVKAEIERMKQAQEKAKAEDWLDVREKKIRLEQQEAEAKMRLEEEAKDREARRKQDLMEALGRKAAGADALTKILMAAAAGVEAVNQDVIAAAVRGLEADFSHMSADQIASVLAVRYPEAAEKIAAQRGATTEELSKLYDRMVQNEQAHVRELHKFLETAVESMARAAGGTKAPAEKRVRNSSGSSDAKICPHCKAVVDPTLTICPKCGKPM